MPESSASCKTLSHDEVSYVLGKISEAKAIATARKGKTRVVKERVGGEKARIAAEKAVREKEKERIGRETARIFSKIVQPIYYYRTETKRQTPRQATPLIESEAELARYYKACMEDAEKIVSRFAKEMKTEVLKEAVFDAIATQIYFIQREYKVQRAKNPPYMIKDSEAKKRRKTK